MEWSSKMPTGFDCDGVEPAEIARHVIETDKDVDTASLCNGFENGSSSRNPFVTSGYGLASSIPVSCAATKRSRASYQKMQNPCCQVEGCNLDLTLAKDYHRRHRICEGHSKSPKVIVAGLERRFCQQCSRFHGLLEFDDNKRSCRRRLSDHNARRRRLQPESVHFSSAGLSSSLYERTSQNVLFNVIPVSAGSYRTGESICNSTLTRVDESFIRPSRTGGIDNRPCFPNEEIPRAVYNLQVESERLLSLQSTNPRVQDQYLPSASSLLSVDNPWSLNRDESISMEGLMHGNTASVDNPIRLWPFVQAAANEGPSVSPVHSTNLHNSGTSLLQEFDIFKTPYDSGCFHSNDQRNI